SRQAVALVDAELLGLDDHVLWAKLAPEVVAEPVRQAHGAQNASNASGSLGSASTSRTSRSLIRNRSIWSSSSSRPFRLPRARWGAAARTSPARTSRSSDPYVPSVSLGRRARKRKISSRPR